MSNAPVIKALQRGVRVIELDLWPNSTKDDVNVLHGRYKLILKSISFDYVVIFLCLFVSLLCYKFLSYYHCSLSILLFYPLFEFRTLTTPVKLIRCLKSIKEHAFVKSPYPVIITLEDHLTHDLQAKVTEVSLFFFFFFHINI